LMLGELSIAQGNRPLGETRLQESLTLCQDTGDRSGVANALHKLAVYKSSFGDYIEGKRLAGQSLRLSRQLGRVDWEGYALDVLGWTTFALGDYEESEACYRESLAVFNKIEDRLGLALALGGIGAAAWAVGGEKLAEAKHYMTQSLELCQAIGNRYHASARLWYLAEISHDAQEYATAQAYGEAGLALAEEVNSPIFASYNLCALGEIACSRGSFRGAREALLQALQIASEAWQLPPLTIALFNLAVLLMKESESLPPPLAQEKRLQALEQLRLLANQPACWHVFKQRAAQVRARLETTLPSEFVQERERRAQQMDLKEAVTAILSAL
jgi:tetratricopeptide (TPR) repeat protein